MRILVPEAQAMGSIACIRSLGRAGHEVFAMSEDARALGFASRHCHRAIVVPRGLAPVAMRTWLRQRVDEHGIELILPSEGLVAAMGQAIVDFAALMPVGPDPRRLEQFIGKYELFRFFAESDDPRLRQNLPQTVLMEAGHAWQQSVATLTQPLFAKFDARPDRGLPAQVLRVGTAAADHDRLTQLLQAHGRGIAQAFAPGVGVGVFFLRWNGQVLASLMHRRLHEVPHTGGVSSYRETWWDDALYADALRRIEALDWWGVGMLEYRWDRADGSFRLMEFNARFWGSLHLALFAGVDLPRLLVDAWAGRPVEPQRARLGVRCRHTFPKDVEHLWSVLRDSGLDAGRKLAALGEFARLGLDPSVYSDLWFPGDRALYWRALRETPGKFLRRA